MGKSSGSNSTPEPAPAAVIGMWMVVAGGVLGALSPLGTLPLVVGVSLLVLGAVLSAPDAGRRGQVIGPWWSVLAITGLVALIGAGLELPAPGLGRLLVVPASVVALVTAGLTLPMSRSGRTEG